MRIRALDIAAIAITGILAFTASLPVFFSAKADTVIVEYDGGAFEMEIGENASRRVDSNGHSLTVSIENGKVFVSSADCPDKLCLHSGSIERSGETLVCLPAKVMIRIKGAGGVDGVAG